MLKFIFGKNIYLIDKEIKQIEADFSVVDSSGINLEKLDGVSITLTRLSQAVNTMPFLSDKRLVELQNLIIENKDNDLKNAIADTLSVLASSKTIDLVIVEKGEPDKRLRLFKQLQKLAKVTECPELIGAALNKWVAEQFKLSDINVKPADAEYLVALVGTDMQKLMREIEKIGLYIKSQKRSELSRHDIELLACPEINPNIFQFTDAIAIRDAATATRLLYEFMQNGESEQKLLGTLAYQFRALITIKDALNRGISTNELARLAKISPYIINKNLAVARVKPLKSLIIMYDQLRRTDSAIKSGDLAPELAIDILVTSLCR